MASDQNRIAPQRHQLLQMVLSQKLAGSESDVTIRSGSPALSDSFGKDLSGVALLGGSTGASQLGGGRGIEAEPYISDRYMQQSLIIRKIIAVSHCDGAVSSLEHCSKSYTETAAQPPL